MPLVGFASALAGLTRDLTLAYVQNGTFARVGAQILTRHAQDIHPKRTGFNASKLNTHASSLGGVGVRLELFGTKVSMWTITGTRPHPIDPVRASVLHWVDSDGDHFASHVEHPGTRANDWRPKVIYAARPEIIALGLEASRYEMHQLAGKMRGAA